MCIFAVLVAGKVQRKGPKWEPPSFVVSLWTPEKPWRTLAGRAPRKGRGQCKHNKPPLKTVLEQVEYVVLESGDTVGFLAHFLEAVGLADANPGSRAKSFNSQLRARGLQDQIFQEKVPGKCGRDPWVCSEDTLVKVYDLV